MFNFYIIEIMFLLTNALFAYISVIVYFLETQMKQLRLDKGVSEKDKTSHAFIIL